MPRIAVLSRDLGRTVPGRIGFLFSRAYRTSFTVWGACGYGDLSGL